MTDPLAMQGHGRKCAIWNEGDCDCKPDHDEGYECGICGADLGPSTSYPWHYYEEDCRAIRQPNPGPDPDEHHDETKQCLECGARVYSPGGVCDYCRRGEGDQ